MFFIRNSIIIKISPRRIVPILHTHCLLQEALEGYKQCSIVVNSNPEEVRKRAMADPEVQSILCDPAMRLILEQMQNDPKALQE